LVKVSEGQNLKIQKCHSAVFVSLQTLMLIMLLTDLLFI